MAKSTAAAPNKNTKTTSSSASSPPHPPYFEMISEAILALKDRTGSSQPAIAKFVEDKYKKVLPENYKKVLSVQLKKFVKSERLVKVKNSYKISSTEKLKLAIKETQKAKAANNAAPAAKKAVTAPKVKAARKITEKGVKTKRLSQIKTPDVLKKAKGYAKASAKKVKNPDGPPKNKKNLTPMKRKSDKAASLDDKPKKKARK
ncbi:hypothetical protein Tsubulata_032048 [Turnera subulata]|uniref:H15 domain-containing protein n=1 Tax=Turnera subulata TaxID=218843 RepID=A0A9Q0JFX8_9ROSI|nr:hypothetical protein Tsubulata_032048 [Turnera subulata]